MLSIVFHTYKNTKYLSKSIEGIFEQTDKNFRFVLINDGAIDKVSKILEQFDFKKIKHFSYYKWNQNIGHSGSFNLALQNLSNDDYVIYTGSNVILDKDFVKVVNNTIRKTRTDVISFCHSKNDESFKAFNKLNNELKLKLHQSMRDKIFSVELLKENNILLKEDFFSPLVFLYEAVESAKKWLVVDFVMATYFENEHFTYNLYDIFTQNEFLFRKYSNTTFWKHNFDLIEYFMVVYVLYIFLLRLLKTHNNNKIRSHGIDVAKEWLNNYLPNWRKNKLLNNSKNINPIIFNKFKKINFSYFLLIRFYRKNDLI